MRDRGGDFFVERAEERDAVPQTRGPDESEQRCRRLQDVDGRVRDEFCVQQHVLAHHGHDDDREGQAALRREVKAGRLLFRADAYNSVDTEACADWEDQRDDLARTQRHVFVFDEELYTLESLERQEDLACDDACLFVVEHDFLVQETQEHEKRRQNESGQRHAYQVVHYGCI